MDFKKIFTNENCVGCHLCIKNCICNEANSAEKEGDTFIVNVDEDKCILCGECVRNCMYGSRDYNDDTDAFFNDLRAGKEIPVIAAPALRSNFTDWPQLISYLKSLGVQTVFDASFGADICTWAYLRYMTANDVTGLVSQPCPAVVNYIEKYTPELLPRLAPIHSPTMCTAIYMSTYKNIPGPYAFLSPCIAKTDEFSDPNTNGLVRYNVTFKKLADYLNSRGIDYSKGASAFFDNDAHGLGSIFSCPGGLTTNVEQHVKGKSISRIEGDMNVYSFLDRYTDEKGSDVPFLVDILNCQFGCNIGPGSLCSPPDEYKVEKVMHNVQTEAEGNKPDEGLPPGPDFTEFDKTLKLSDFYRKYTAKPIAST